MTMTREEIMQLNTDYLNDCESEHEMNELFYYVLELQKHEQEMVEALDKIKEEIEQIEINGHIRDVECFRAGINTTLNIINKYMAKRTKK